LGRSPCCQGMNKVLITTALRVLSAVMNISQHSQFPPDASYLGHVTMTFRLLTPLVVVRGVGSQHTSIKFVNDGCKYLPWMSERYLPQSHFWRHIPCANALSLFLSAFLSGRSARIPRSSLRSQKSTIRFVWKSQNEEQHQALRAPGIHHGQLWRTYSWISQWVT